MAITISPIAGLSAKKGPLRGEKFQGYVISPDASIPAAGYTIAASALNLSTLDFAIAAAPFGSYFAQARIDSVSSSKLTLAFYNMSCTSTNAATDIGTAVAASLTNLTTNPVTLFVIGR